MPPLNPLARRLLAGAAAFLIIALPRPTAHAGGAPYGWGSQAPIPLAAPVDGLIDADGNGYSFVGVRADGRVLAWGNNAQGLVGRVPHDLRVAAAPGAPKPIDAAACYSNIAVLLDDGTVRVWGESTREVMTVPAELSTAPAPGAPKAVEIAAGFNHLVVRMDDGSLRAWGATSPLAGFAAFATPPGPGMPLPVALACSSYTTAVLYDDGSVGGFGVAAVTVAVSPPFPGSPKAVRIAGMPGYWSSPIFLLTRDDGTVQPVGYSFGYASYALSITGAVEAVPCNGGILFRRADGSVGAAGSVAGADHVPPTVAKLPIGGQYPLVILADGTMRHLGNLHFYLTDGQPVHAEGKNIVDLAIGMGQTIALDSTGKLTAWDDFFRLAPPPAEAATVFTDVAIGDRSFTGTANPVVLAVRADGTVAAWGADYGGLISTLPAGLANVKSLATGQEFAVAVRHDGTAVAWGSRAAANNLDSGAAALSAVESVAAGASHALALHSGGTVSAWGDNTDFRATVPPGLTGVVAVAASNFNSFALKSDGTVVAWGSGTSPGQFMAVPTNLTSPPAPGNPKAVGIAAGSVHAVVCFDDGSVQAWGEDLGGNLYTPSGSLGEVRAIHAGGRATVALVGQTPIVRMIAVEANESACPAGIEFRLDYPAEQAIDINYSLGGSASLGSDYTAAASSGVFTIPAGATSALLPLAVIDDYLVEPDEEIVITATSASPTQAILFEGSVVFRILNDDTDPPVLSVADLRVDEEGGAATVSVTLDRAAAVAVSVDYNMGGGTATPGGDWSAAATSGTLTIPAGTLSASLPFSALSDALVEGDETFTVALSAPVNAVIGRGAATVTITDDDIAPPQVSIGDVSVFEGHRSALVPVVLNRPAPGDVVLFFRTVAGTALPGRDYASRTASLLIPEGETTATIALQILENSVAGRDLHFSLELTAASGGVTIADASADIAIRDNDRLAAPPWGGVPVVWGDGSPGAGGAPAVPVPAPVLTKLAAGADFVIGLRQNGSVLGWSNNAWPSGPPIPAGITDAVDVAAGLYHSLVLHADGTVTGYGSPSAMTAESVRPGVANIIAISAGRFHSLALTADGQVLAWGFDGNGQCSVPADLPPIVAISAGEVHSMALSATGEVYCWGSNLQNESIVPPGIGPCIAIAAGNLRSLAIGADGQVHYWGYALAGSAVPPPFNAPAAPGAPRMIQANVAGDHVIGLLDDGTVVSWGNLATHNQQVPGSLPHAFQVSGGQFFSVALVETTAPPAVLLDDADAAEGLTAVFGQVRLESIAAVDVTVTLAIESGTATAPEDFTTSSLSVTIPAGSSSGFYSIPLVDDDLIEPDESFRVRLVDIPEGFRAGPSAKITILDNDSIRKPYAWGAGAHLPMTSPPGTAIALAGGSEHTLFLRDDGKLLAWGSNRRGQGDVPPEIRPDGASSASAIAAGDGHSLALTDDGRVLAWGLNQNGQCNVPASLATTPVSSGATPVAIAAGLAHSLALLQDGTVLAWGAEPGGFGSGPFVDQGQTLVPPGLTGATAIAAGAFHSLAIAGDGVVHQWGSDGFGEMLVPTVLQSPPASGAPHPVALAAGYSHSLALLSDGSVITWGNGAGGPAALPPALASAPPAGSRAVAIAAGNSHSLALLENGTVLAWGGDWDGQATVPAGIGSASVLGSGYSHSLAFTTSGLHAWGFNGAGQCDVPDLLPRLRALGRPGAHAVAIANDRSPVAWGENADGQTTPPPGLDRVRRITAGSDHTLAIDSTGTAHGWGQDFNGQAAIPVGLGRVRELSGSSYHSLAARVDGSLAAWGTAYANETTPPPYVYNAIDVAAGLGFSVALLDDGKVLAWGDPWSGATSVPPALTAATAIACGDYHVLALQSDGTVLAWGNNDNGQCNVPAGLANVVAIAAGQAHSIALTAAGTLVAWGSDEFGESTVPAGLGQVCTLNAGFRQNILLLAEPAGGAAGHMLRWASDSGLDPDLFDPLHLLGGLSGQLRFAFNLDAFDFAYSSYTAGGDASGLPSIAMVELPGGTRVLRFTYIRRGDAGLSYVPEVSPSLESGSWSPVTATPAITPLDDIWEQVVIDHPIPPGLPQLFGRLNVTAPGDPPAAL